MTATATLHYQTDKFLPRNEVQWCIDQALAQINDYVYSNARWNVWWRDYVRDRYGRYVNGINDLRGNLYLSAYYNGRSRASCYKIALHEMAHNWNRYHHGSPGMLGRGGVGPYTFTAADFRFMRPRRKPGPAPWEDARNKPEVVADTVVIPPGWYGYVDVLKNDRQARGWGLQFHGNQATSTDPRVETVAIGGRGIKVVTYPEFRECTIKYQVRTEMGSDSAVWGELKVVAEPERFEWCNPDNRYDVDGSGDVTARDALLVINRSGEEVDESRPANDTSGKRIYPDVNDDGRVSSIDALQVINNIRRMNETLRKIQ